MTIRSMHQAKASQAVKEQRDIAVSVVHRRSSVLRSTQDGGTTRTNTNSASFSALFREYTNREVIGAQREGSATTIQPNDVQCRFAVKDIGLSVEILPQDLIVTADATFTVVHATRDKNYAWWTLQLRRP